MPRTGFERQWDSGHRHYHLHVARGGRGGGRGGGGWMPRIPRSWKFRLGKWVLVGSVVMMVVEHYYFPGGVPLVPGIACQGAPATPGPKVQAAAYQQAGNPFGVPAPSAIGGFLLHATLGSVVKLVGWEAGRAIRAVEQGPPPKENVDATWQGIAHGLGSLVGSFFAGIAGKGNPAQQQPPKKPSKPLPFGIVPMANKGPVADGPLVAARAALLAGFSKSQAVTAVAIAGAESSWHRTAVNPITVNGSRAHGTWQVMLPMHADVMHGSWANPYVNARAARAIYNGSHSWAPWTTYTSGAYRGFLPVARTAVAKALHQAVGGPGPGCNGVAGAVPVLAAGPYAAPLASATYTDLNNYGRSGSHWSSLHTGDDLAAACGTPVRAANNGTVQVDSGGGWAWAGRWLVKVVSGPHRFTTWYAHMQALHVRNGQAVKAGQLIGNVGQLGNATGCHLHFEIHPHNGGMYADQINPHPWLVAHDGKGPILHG